MAFSATTASSTSAEPPTPRPSPQPPPSNCNSTNSTMQPTTTAVRPRHCRRRRLFTRRTPPPRPPSSGLCSRGLRWRAPRGVRWGTVETPIPTPPQRPWRPSRAAAATALCWQAAVYSINSNPIGDLPLFTMLAILRTSRSNTIYRTLRRGASRLHLRLPTPTPPLLLSHRRLHAPIAALPFEARSITWCIYSARAKPLPCNSSSSNCITNSSSSSSMQLTRSSSKRSPATELPATQQQQWWGRWATASRPLPTAQ